MAYSIQHTAAMTHGRVQNWRIRAKAGGKVAALARGRKTFMKSWDHSPAVPLATFGTLIAIGVRLPSSASRSALKT